MTKNNTVSATSQAEELLKLLGVTATVASEEKQGESLYLTLETETPGLLIGHHGETLAAFQLILNMMLAKKLGEWQKVVVTVGDYRAKRKEQITHMAEDAASRVVATGQDVALPPMSSFERRIIHLALAGHEQVITESDGDASSRHIVVKPKK